MLLKRSGKLILLAIAVFSMLVSVWGTALAESYTDTSADFGGQGVVMPAGLSQDNLQVELVKPSGAGNASLRFRGPILDISYNVDGNELTFPPSLTYVYFNMNSVERAAWDRGSADIYYRDLDTNSWRRCGTTFVVQADDPQRGRLACVAPQFTMYGLGINREIEQLRPGLVDDEGSVNASITENAAVFGNQGVDVPAGFNRNQLRVRMLHQREAPAMPFQALRRVIHLEWIGNITQQQVLSDQQQPATGTITSTATTTGTVATGVSASASPPMPLSMTYVYFNVNNSQRNDWDQGNLHIYYYDQSSKSWARCPAAFFVNLNVAGEDDDESDNGGGGRIACVAPQFTYYALGMARDSSESQSESQSEPSSETQ